MWSEPWIPVATFSGEQQYLGIDKILENAHNLKGIFDPSPLVTISLHRLLLAIVYRLYQPNVTAHWQSIWESKQFDPELISNYGQDYGSSFDIFHPRKPFYQVPLIPEETIHPISAIIIEAASGNNPTLFDHPKDSVLHPAEVARHLVTHQLYAIGGGVSKPFNRMDAPLTKGIAVQALGRNLWETLLLNLLPLKSWGLPISDDDAPFWELQFVEEPDKGGTIPLGPLHYLTWQSRQLHLCRDQETGLVTGVQIRQRFALPKDGFNYDPYKPYLISESEGKVPLKSNKQHALWHSTTTLLLKKTTEKSVPLRLTTWLAEIPKVIQEDLKNSLGYLMVALITHPKKAAKIEQWRREQLTISGKYFEDDELVHRLEELLDLTKQFERILNRTGHVLAWALADKKQLPEAIRFFWTGQKSKAADNYSALGTSYGLSARYWAEMEEPFRQLVIDLPNLPQDVARTEWVNALGKIAREAFADVRDSLSPYEQTHEVLVKVNHVFHSKLQRIISGELPEGEEDNDGEANG